MLLGRRDSIEPDQLRVIVSFLGPARRLVPAFPQGRDASLLRPAMGCRRRLPQVVGTLVHASCASSSSHVNVIRFRCDGTGAVERTGDRRQSFAGAAQTDEHRAWPGPVAVPLWRRRAVVSPLGEPVTQVRVARPSS